MDYERTPLPVPVDPAARERERMNEARERMNTGSFAMPPPPPPPPTPNDIMNLWWKAIVGTALGFTAVGSLTWIIARQFFVTRDEWVAAQPNFQNISNQMNQLQRSVDNQTLATKENSAGVAAINLKMAQIEAAATATAAATAAIRRR